MAMWVRTISMLSPYWTNLSRKITFSFIRHIASSFKTSGFNLKYNLSQQVELQFICEHFEVLLLHSEHI